MEATPRLQEDAVIVTAENRSRALAGTPFFFQLAANLCSRLHYGALTFVLPDRPALTFIGVEETDAHGIIFVKDYAFARRAILGGDIGFFESFADDQWDTPDLADCLYIFARNADHVKEAFKAAPVIDWLDNMRHALNKNTRKGAKRNIAAHYDLGNGFYEKWLDRTMTYSSAVYPAPTVELYQAQTHKYRVLAERIALRPDESLLEIGSGWGGFAEFAAKDVGARVTGLTISPAQHAYASQRIQKEGLGEKVEIRLQDYRDVAGRFDKLVSIEMFEAVGKEYWAQYFSKIHDVLKPGGVAGLQIITIADRFFDAYQRSTDFIQRHIFPGGMLPSPSALKSQIESANLAWAQEAAFGADYARTLSAWHQRFLDAWDDIQTMGFDDRFKKLWRFYLGYCEAGFRAGTTNVMQVAAIRPA